MAGSDRGLIGTPWEPKDNAFAEPGVDGTLSGGADQRGGRDLGDGTEKESANSMSGLPPRIDFVQTGDDCPAPGSTAEVFPGVTSPAEVAGNIKGGDR